MLLLSRRIGESIGIKLPDGRMVTVTIAEIRTSKQVRLGVIADPDIVVHRCELWDAIEQANLDNPMVKTVG